MASRVNGQVNKRRLLLDAAIKVFARKGYHASRVGDVAQEAGVAYGLLYHYFGSKEEVLETIFRETWAAMLEAVHGIEATGAPARDQVRKVAAVVLGSWKLNPDLIRVLIREVTRSPHIQQEIEEIGQAFDTLERIVRRGQAAGEFRPTLEPRLAAWVLYGAMEEILTGWVIERPPADDEEVALAAQNVTEILCDGLVADGAPRDAGRPAEPSVAD
ncbi:MAG: TetR/AcrR family transcriptional regulator [Thermoleophilia bacterium]|nr:TetR/AcrR family transcriptional regulator [Thermoleophilia bacterium]